MLPEREALPGDDEDAGRARRASRPVRARHACDAAAPSSARGAALDARLAQFSPLLAGGVAAGWATEHSDIRLELVAADAKSVELVLLNAGESYRAMGVDRDGATELYLDARHPAFDPHARAGAPAPARPHGRRCA